MFILVGLSGVPPFCVIDPSGHRNPGAHCPEHAAVGRLVVLPYVPKGHGVQLTWPTVEYVPAGHAVCVVAVHEYPAGHNLLPDPEPLIEVLPYGSIDPAGHIYPGEHGSSAVPPAQ